LDKSRKLTVPDSGKIAKLSSMEATRLTTLQRELLRFVAIIAGMATAVAILMVILWAAWLVTFLIYVVSCSPIRFFRLRKDHPDYINVSGLLIDVVSVMGPFFVYSILI
jgi:sodium/potassium-transporting ATPase subunit alpha